MRKKLIKFKKAQYAADTAPFYLVFGVVITILFLTFMWLLAYYTSDETKIPDGVEYDILTQRFSSSDCFGYTTFRLSLDQGDIFDGYKLIDGQNKLDYCYNTTSTEAPAFKIKPAMPGSNELKTKNWQESSFEDKTIPEDVLLFFENIFYKSRLFISIQWEKIRFD